MQRLSSRLVAAMAGVRCPACGKTVMPQSSEGTPEAAAPAAPETRWSFVWRRPSGMICPECLYPLERYQRRGNWIRLFTAGAVLLIIEVILLMFGGILGGITHDMVIIRGVLRVVGMTGIALLLVGATGFIIGSRHGVR